MIQYLGWPDNDVPHNAIHLFEIMKMLKEVCPKKTVIHCSSGVGRTGTFIALSRLIDQICNESKYLDVFKTVLRLRGDRKFMVRFFFTIRRLNFMHTTR